MKSTLVLAAIFVCAVQVAKADAYRQYTASQFLGKDAAAQTLAAHRETSEVNIEKEKAKLLVKLNEWGAPALEQKILRLERTSSLNYSVALRLKHLAEKQKDSTKFADMSSLAQTANQVRTTSLYLISAVVKGQHEGITNPKTKNSHIKKFIQEAIKAVDAAQAEVDSAAQPVVIAAQKEVIIATSDLKDDTAQIKARLNEMQASITGKLEDVLGRLDAQVTMISQVSAQVSDLTKLVKALGYANNVPVLMKNGDGGRQIVPASSAKAVSDLVKQVQAYYLSHKDEVNFQIVFTVIPEVDAVGSDATNVRVAEMRAQIGQALVEKALKSTKLEFRKITAVIVAAPRQAGEKSLPDRGVTISVGVRDSARR